MAYKLIVSNNAEDDIDKIIGYIMNDLVNDQAAKAILDDIENAYLKLEEAAEIYPLCNDSYLASKGYRQLPLDKHGYLIIYQVLRDEVHIAGVFHTRDNYNHCRREIPLL